MVRLKGKLLKKDVEALITPGKYQDGNGLFLLVRGSGSKSWVLRTTVHGNRMDIGLGAFPMISLDEARERSEELRKTARTGGDPLAEKRSAVTLEQAVREYHRSQSRSFTSATHTKQWIRTFELYVFPTLKNRPTHTIESADILKVLNPIWTTKSVTALGLRIRLSGFFDWAFVSKYYTKSNPVRGVEDVLPKQNTTVDHHSAMDWRDVPSFYSGIEHPILKFLILTCVRSTECREARWSEIDFAEKVWLIPKERMKMKRPHRVPLTDEMLTLLELQKGLNKEFVFPSMQKRVSAPVSRHMMPRMMIGTDKTVHGFRSSFRDWVSERHPDKDREDEAASDEARVAEAVLAHVVGSRTERAYARSDLFDRRRVLMSEWCRYVVGQ